MSLDLNPRQRAMLREMGVRVWWPLPSALPPDQTAAQTIADSAVDTRSATKKPVNSLAEQRDPQAPAPGLGTVSSMDWSELRQAIARCQACGLCAGRRAPVFGADARQRADWLVLGEPVDADEERAGEPFAGAAGALLDNMLRAVGVSRRAGAGTPAPAESAYVTNCVKCRPGAARNPQAAELQACEHFLRRELTLVQPKVILALGRFAAQTVLQGSAPELAATPLGKLRGTVHRYQGIAVVVSYAPTSLLRNPLDKARAWADLCLARHTLSTMSR